LGGGGRRDREKQIELEEAKILTNKEEMEYPIHGAEKAKRKITR